MQADLSLSDQQHSNQIKPILIRVYSRKRGWPDLPQHQSLLLPFSISLDSWRPFSPNQRSCSPSPLASSTCFFGRPGFLLPLTSNSSERAHHPSSTHARTISLHSPFPSGPLFPPILTSTSGLLYCYN